MGLRGAWIVLSHWVPCTRYQPVQHPVWGDIVGVVTLNALSQGQELFCDYGYDPDTQVRGAVDLDFLSL